MRDPSIVHATVAAKLYWGWLVVAAEECPDTPPGGRGRPMDTKAGSLDPALPHLVTEMNLFGTVY
jgi:hypothetical protein